LTDKIKCSPSYGYAPKQPQYGWDTTSQDYRAHLSRMQRVPTALNEVPYYPSVYKVLKNKYTYGEEEETPQEQQQKVQMNEHVEVVESSTNDENCEVRQGNVDADADGFIQRKRRGFELCKWTTFKVP
ncbi:Arf-GAP with Rho-GAP domain, ANK repeat and PH domain-containing protein, partial [Melia azedarach]